jgi:hypothetical protein
MIEELQDLIVIVVAGVGAICGARGNYGEMEAQAEDECDAGERLPKAVLHAWPATSHGVSLGTIEATVLRLRSGLKRMD